MNTKQYSIYRLFLVLFFGAVWAFAGCKKDDGPIKEDILSRIDAVPAVSTNIDASGSQAIDFLDLATFQGKFSASLYFANATPPEKVDIVVRKNSNANVKVYKADVTSLPANFSLTAADIETLFGEPVAIGDNYDFSADIYVNGKKFEAFPAVGVGTASGPKGMPGYSEFARFSVVCAYDPEIYQGDFEVVSDDFEEFVPGDIITLTKVSDNSFSFEYNPPSSTGPYTPAVVTINTLNNQASIAKTVVASAKIYTYTNPTIQTDATATSSFVSPCDEALTISLAYNVDQGTFGGGYLLILKKKH